MTAFRSFGEWTFAFFCSIVLNVSLFGLMPGLIQRLPNRPDVLENIEQVRVIRIKRAEPVARRQRPEKIKPARPEKKPAGSHTRSPAPRPVTLKPQLAFQLNPKLPAAPMDLVMPGLEHFSMDAPVLKAHYSMGELDSPLIPLVKIPPIYPIRASRRGIEGFVIVQFLVTKNGEVERIKIIEAHPKKIFDQNVIHCVSQWIFKPGTVEGIPVATLTRTTIRFKLEK